MWLFICGITTTSLRTVDLVILFKREGNSPLGSQHFSRFKSFKPSFKTKKTTSKVCAPIHNYIKIPKKYVSPTKKTGTLRFNKKKDSPKNKRFFQPFFSMAKAPPNHPERTHAGRTGQDPRQARGPTTQTSS